MTSRRWARVIEVLAAHANLAAEQRLCLACVEVLGVTGASLTLIDDMLGREWGCGSSDAAVELEAAQFLVGEGPSMDAFVTRRPVHEPRLAAEGADRWPAFAPSAPPLGIAAAFAYPLQIGGARIGAMTLYNDTAGELAVEQLADALVLADVMTGAILAVQAEAPDGTLAWELAGDHGLDAAVHQASGMVAVQLAVPIREALVRMRAHAYGAERGLREIAGDVVARRLRLDR